METRSYREPLGVVAAICPFSMFFLLFFSLPPATTADDAIHRLPCDVCRAAVLLLECC